MNGYARTGVRESHGESNPLAIAIAPKPRVYVSWPSLGNGDGGGMSGSYIMLARTASPASFSLPLLLVPLLCAE